MHRPVRDQLPPPEIVVTPLAPQFTDRPSPRRLRRAAAAGLALAVALLAAAPAEAASRTETVVTPDGWTLPVEVYTPNGAGEDTPVVILLHGEKGNRKNWQSLAEYLEKMGYAVLAPDLRKHGEASMNGRTETGEEVRSADYRGMLRFDLEAVKALAVQLHQNKQLNIRKLGIVAAENSAPVALLYTYADWLKKPLVDAPDPAYRTPTGQDVRAVALLSPEDSVPGLNPGKVLRQLADDGADIAFLILYGSEDQRDGGAAKDLFERLGGEKTPRVVLAPVPGVPLRGTSLLRPPLGEKLFQGLARQDGKGFLDLYLKARPDPWQDRAGRR
ncbi:alpha/beta hydrolase [Alienimonas californiensis]|uniref:Alpha/beta hydrolase family protein n=1 Tax=Alienimonas californiensis TaxID=2527989 RepID=A0A517P823_9PLAN|nr:alpha/beta fold hydrolase [Alienimonas californiensis]QDT15527.1 Alpha/beta hydrolase family protein [Alienimonas californiensis]